MLTAIVNYFKISVVHAVGVAQGPLIPDSIPKYPHGQRSCKRIGYCKTFERHFIVLN